METTDMRSAPEYTVLVIRLSNDPQSRNYLLSEIVTHSGKKNQPHSLRKTDFCKNFFFQENSL